MITIDYHWLSLIIIDYYWLSLIIIDYHWLSLNIIDYHWLSFIIIDDHWLSLMMSMILLYRWSVSLRRMFENWRYIHLRWFCYNLNKQFEREFFSSKILAKLFFPQFLSSVRFWLLWKQHQNGFQLSKMHLQWNAWAVEGTYFHPQIAKTCSYSTSDIWGVYRQCYKPNWRSDEASSSQKESLQYLPKNSGTKLLQ